MTIEHNTSAWHDSPPAMNRDFTINLRHLPAAIMVLSVAANCLLFLELSSVKTKLATQTQRRITAELAFNNLAARQRPANSLQTWEQGVTQSLRQQQQADTLEDIRRDLRRNR